MLFTLALLTCFALFAEISKALNGTSCTWEKPFPNLILTENETLSFQLSDYIKCGVQVQYKLSKNESSPLIYELLDSLENLMHSYFIAPQIMTKSILKSYNNIILFLHNTSYTVMSYKLDPVVAIKINSVNQEVLRFNFELIWANYKRGITQKRVDSQDLTYYANSKYAINCSYFYDLNERDGIILDCVLIGTERPRPPQIFLNYVINSKKNGFVFNSYQFLQDVEMLDCDSKRMRFEPNLNTLLRFCRTPTGNESVVQVWQKYDENAFFLLFRNQVFRDDLAGLWGLEFYKSTSIVVLHWQGLSMLSIVDLSFKKLDSLTFDNRNCTAILHKITESAENDFENGRQIFSLYANSTIAIFSIDEKRTNDTTSSIVFNFTKYIELEDNELPIESFFTPRYLALNYEGRLKIFLPEGTWFDCLTSTLQYEKLSYDLDPAKEHMFLRFFQDSMEDNIIIVSRDLDSDPYSWSSDTYRWLLNVTQVIKRTIRLSCCLPVKGLEMYSMLNMPFTISLYNDSVQIQTIKIPVYFWELDEKNVFYAPQPNLNEKGALETNEYAFDTERIYVALWSYILGPFAQPSIQLTRPYMRDISIKGFARKKLNGLKGKIIEQMSTLDDLVVNKQYLKVTLIQNGMECFWQSKQSKKLKKITCQGEDSAKNYDCIVEFEKEIDGLIQNVIGPFGNYYFLINDAKTVDVLHQKDPISKEYDYDKATFPDLKCDDIYFVRRKMILLCFWDKQVFKAFKVYPPAEGENQFKFTTIGWTKKLYVLFNISPQSIKQVHFELADLSCILILTDSQLMFFEILINEEDDTKSLPSSFDLELKNSLPLDNKNVVSFVSVLSESQRRLILVYLYTYNILEYNLDRNPFKPVFSRRYPTFEFEISDCYMNGRNFLVVSAFENQKPYELIYNIMNPTCNLLTNKLFDPYVYLYGRIFVADNFLQPSNSRGVFIEWESLDEIHLIEYGDFELVGSVPIIQERNLKLFQYEVHISYNNSLSNRHVVQSLKINITLNDTVLNIKQNGRFYRNSVVSAFNNDKFCGKVFSDGSHVRVVLNDDLFAGPVQAYNMKYYINNEEVKSRKRYDTIPFLLLTSYFAEYQDVLEKYGKLVQMEKFENITVLLTSQTLTFVLNDEEFRELESLRLENKCEILSKHNLESRMLLLCRNDNGFYLQHVNFTLNFTESGETFKFLCKTQAIDIADKTISSIIHLYFKDSLVVLVLRRLKTEDEVSYFLYTLFVNDKGNFELFPTRSLAHQYSPTDSTLFSLEIFQIESNDIDILYGALQMLNNKINVFSIKISKKIPQNTTVKSMFKTDIEDVRLGVIDTLEFLPKIVLGRVKLAIKSISLIAVEPEASNLTLKVLLTTNVHIYHSAITLNKSFVFNKVDIVHTYRKYYACENKAGLRPILFEGFLGSFCDKVAFQSDTPNFAYSGTTSDSLNRVTYFVLHKTLPGDESSPIRAMQILIDIFQFLFLGGQKSGAEKSINAPFSCNGCIRLLLPSYFNLFTQYILTPNLTIFQKNLLNDGEQNDNSIKLVVTASNDASNVSITIDLTPSVIDDSNKTIGIVLGVISAVLIFALLLGSIIYSKMSKNFKAEDGSSKILLQDEDNIYSKPYYSSHIDSTSVDDWYRKKSEML